MPIRSAYMVPRSRLLIGSASINMPRQAHVQLRWLNRNVSCYPNLGVFGCFRGSCLWALDIPTPGPVEPARIEFVQELRPPVKPENGRSWAYRVVACTRPERTHPNFLTFILRACSRFLSECEYVRMWL